MDYNAKYIKFGAWINTNGVITKELITHSKILNITHREINET